MTEYIRTPRGVYEKVDSFWGQFYILVDDPLSEVDEIDDDSFKLKPTFPKIPAHLWNAIVNFYWHYATRGLEAQVLLLIDQDTCSKWKVVVPEQMVSSASVETADFSKACDIITGEAIDGWEPKGYSHAGLN